MRQSGQFTIPRRYAILRSHLHPARRNYEVIIYGKAPLFLAGLRHQLGAPAFGSLLRAYLERYHWRIATPADFQAVAEQVSGRDLDALFAKWVEGRE